MKNNHFNSYLFIIVILLNVALLPQTSVNILPGSLTVNSAGTVSVQLLVSNIANLHSASVNIGFDSTVLRYSSISNGSFLQSNNMGYSVVLFKTFYPNSISPNQVKVGQDILGNASVTGSGLLFTINFTTNHAGRTAISIADFTMLDLNSNIISASSISGSVTVSINLSPKAFFEGSYNGTTMNTTLNSSSYLPLHQPYTGAPWNYSGNESVGGGYFSKHSNIVDWVLLELRSGTSADSIVAKRAAFILNNGNIVDLDGSSNVRFSGPAAWSYYIVIKHRNHIAVMSAAPQALDLAVVSYDFTTASTQAYGNNLLKIGSKWCIYAGDVNQDGIVDSGDLRIVDNENANYVSGYTATDLNGDGIVDSGDLGITDNNK